VEMEQLCDDGNTTWWDGCSATCQLEVCGDTKVDVWEQCDDGNAINGDGCDNTCMLELADVCGDGTLHPDGVDLIAW